MPLLFFMILNKKRKLLLRNMKSISTIKDSLTPYAIAVFVPAFLSIMGFGIYHGEFHFSSNTTHCHSDKVCHNH